VRQHLEDLDLALQRGGGRQPGPQVRREPPDGALGIGARAVEHLADVVAPAPQLEHLPLEVGVQGLQGRVEQVVLVARAQQAGDVRQRQPEAHEPPRA
jgi:hypothetical protein